MDDVRAGLLGHQHRYDGVCKRPHGHNAVAEIEVCTGVLDPRNMVCDFSDVKRIAKGWIDEHLDHKMILRKDDSLVRPSRRSASPSAFSTAIPPWSGSHG